MDYAITQNNLGNACRTLAEVERKPENCKNAIRAYDEALKVFTMADFPEVYLPIEQNLRTLKELCKSG